jgi:hypothetical protein
MEITPPMTEERSDSLCTLFEPRGCPTPGACSASHIIERLGAALMIAESALAIKSSLRDGEQAKVQRSLELVRDAVKSLAPHSTTAQRAMTEERSDSPHTEAMMEVTDEMINRFLSWPLPDSVCSDLCVTQRDYGKAQGWPKRVGTNLLTADEARQMLEYVLSLSA